MSDYYEEYVIDGKRYGIEKVKVGRATAYGPIIEGAGPYETREQPAFARDVLKEWVLDHLDKKRDELALALAGVIRDRAQITAAGLSVFLVKRNAGQRARAI